jgi:hypothetical protein
MVCPSSANHVHAVVAVVVVPLHRKAVTVGAEAAVASVDALEATSPPPQATKAAEATVVSPTPDITRQRRPGTPFDDLFMCFPRF